MKKFDLPIYIIPVFAAALILLTAGCLLLALLVHAVLGWILLAVLLIAAVLIGWWIVRHYQARFERAQRENDQQAAVIEIYDADERNNLLAGLLQEDTQNNETYLRALHANFDLSGPYYAVAILSLPEEVQAETGMGRPLLSLCAELDELSARVLHPDVAYSMVNEGILVMIISTGDPEGMPARFERLIDAFYRQKGIPLSIALGHEVYNMREYPFAYRSAQIAYEGMLAEDKPRTLYLDKLTLASNDSVAFFNELHLMLGYLIDNEFVAAAQVCSRVFDVFVQERKSYKTIINERMAMFRNCFLQAIEAAITNDSVAIQGYLECRREMEAPRPLSETHAVFLNIAQLAEQSVARRRKAQIGPAIRIQSFIDQHYTDPMLDIAMISEKLGLSASYISRMFKSAFDQTVLGYITEKRIDKAKELLHDTNATIEDIAAKVGYNSAATFSRAFQKLCATSPNQFRKGGNE